MKWKIDQMSKYAPGYTGPMTTAGPVKPKGTPVKPMPPKGTPVKPMPTPRGPRGIGPNDAPIRPKGGPKGPKGLGTPMLDPTKMAKGGVVKKGMAKGGMAKKGKK